MKWIRLENYCLPLYQFCICKLLSLSVSYKPSPAHRAYFWIQGNKNQRAQNINNALTRNSIIMSTTPLKGNLLLKSMAKKLWSKPHIIFSSKDSKHVQKLFAKSNHHLIITSTFKNGTCKIILRTYKKTWRWS